MNVPIIINATNLGRFIDGIGVYVLNLLRELSQLESDHHFIIYLNRTCAEHVRDIQFPDHCELRWVSSVVSPDLGFKGHLLRLLYSNYLSARHSTSVVFAASQLEAMLFRRDQIIMVHDIIPLLFGALHKKQYYYFKYFLNRVLRRAQWVITPSLHTKELLVEKYGIDESKVDVIHNGVRESLFDRTHQALRRHDGNFILFSGRMVPMKNLAGMLKAFNLIKDKIPHRVVITGHDRRRLPTGTESALLDGCPGARERVEFKGHVSSSEMDELLSHASVLVFPSFYEGFGLPPLEGMAHGCPVVVSRVSSLPEVCGDAAEYVDPSNVESIAHGMYRVLTNSSVRRQLIEKGLQRSKSFSWQESAKQHLEVFDQAIATVQSSAPTCIIQQTKHEASRHFAVPIGVPGVYGLGNGSQR